MISRRFWMLALPLTAGGGLMASSTIRGIDRGPAHLIEAQTASNLRPGELTVMTLNMAHGRGESFHQMLISNSKIEKNVRRIGDLAATHQVDVIALQEVDGPSFWSGRTEHLSWLLEGGHLGTAAHGRHVDGAGVIYGTAIASRARLTETLSVTFAANPPTPPKGFVRVTIPHPSSATGLVDVISVHLDFARAKVRSRQITRIVTEMAGRTNPCIIMGDFNAEWDDEPTVRRLANELGLHTPKQGDPTFPTWSTRLDWILVSPCFEFAEYQVLPDRVSDHRAVLARLRFQQSG